MLARSHSSRRLGSCVQALVVKGVADPETVDQVWRTGRDPARPNPRRVAGLLVSSGVRALLREPDIHR